MIHKVNFQVSLNDGQTLQEGRGSLAEVEGGDSPWRKLLAILEKDSLSIVSLVLVTDDGRTFNLPSSGKNPNFRPFREADKPLSFRVERHVGSESVWDGKSDPNAQEKHLKDWYTVAIAVYNEYELQLWVSELDTKHCWTLAVPLHPIHIMKKSNTVAL